MTKRLLGLTLVVVVFPALSVAQLAITTTLLPNGAVGQIYGGVSTGVIIQTQNAVGSVFCQGVLPSGLVLLSSGNIAPALAQSLRRILANQPQHKRGRSRESKYLLIVYPTNLSKAILVLLGRPWDDWKQPHWGPNGFFFQAPLDNNGEPLAIAGGARKNISTLSWAKYQCWHARTQLAILYRETRQHLRGKRG